MADGLCQYAHQFNNKVLICKVRAAPDTSIVTGCVLLCLHSFNILFCVLCLQRCYEGGREVIVVPKTSASSDNPWFGLAKYAWSG